MSAEKEECQNVGKAIPGAKPVLERLRDTPWYQAAIETHRLAREYMVAPVQCGDASSHEASEREAQMLENHLMKEAEELTLDHREAPHGEANLSNGQEALCSTQNVEEPNLVDEGADSSGAESGEGLVRSSPPCHNNESCDPANDVDQSVEKSLQCALTTMEEVNCNQTQPTTASNSEGQKDVHTIGDSLVATCAKLTPTLSITPISVIAPGGCENSATDNSSGVELVTASAPGANISHELSIEDADHDGACKLPQADPTPDDVYDVGEKEVSGLPTNSVSATGRKDCDTERQTGRRRLSKTIQQLQERLKQEVAGNVVERSPLARSSISPSMKNSRKASGSGRFLRDRSRKRSKSRASFKVFGQSISSKFHTPNAKERPYRQWAGIGTCVSHDTRFIVCSKPQKLALLDRTPSDEAARDGEIVAEAQAIQSDYDTPGMSRKGEQDNAEMGSPHLLTSHVTPETADLSSASTSNRRNSLRERSRHFRRLPSGTERPARPQTPHTGYSGRRQPIGSNDPQSLANSSCEDVSQATKNKRRKDIRQLRDLVDSRSSSRSPQPIAKKPPKVEKSFRPKLPTYGAMRTSMLFTKSTPSRERRAVCSGDIRRDTSNVSDSLSRGGSSHQGSVETLWSDASTPSTRGSGSTAYLETFSRPSHRLKDKNIHKLFAHHNDAAPGRTYIDVQAVADFKGTFPGQLSFRKGQIMKQILYSSAHTTDGMSYGYYRVGRFKRKRKGLYPSDCVAPCGGSVENEF